MFLLLFNLKVRKTTLLRYVQFLHVSWEGRVVHVLLFLEKPYLFQLVLHMICLVNHLPRIYPLPTTTVVLATAPKVLITLTVPSNLLRTGFSIRGKIGKSSVPILVLLLLHVIQHSKIGRKSQYYVLLFLLIARTTWLIWHLNTKYLVGNFEWKCVELCHLFTVLFAHLWVAWTVPVGPYFLILFWNIEHANILHDEGFKVMTWCPSDLLRFSFVVFSELN